MLVQAFKTVLKQTKLIIAPLHSLSPKKLNTEVFSQLTYNQLAHPQFVKALIVKPIHNHSRVSQRSLFHKKRVSGRILTCFSERKHKVFRRVNKIRKQFYSDVLNKTISIVVSRKALKTIEKMGSFDNYILCTKPKDLDSKYGEYLRELMLRKINNPDFRIPYIIGTNRQLRIKKYQRYLYLKDVKKITIPPEFRNNFRTLQKKFGKTPEEFSNQDYAKYLELENLKRTLGDQMEPTHPLLLELKQKMNNSFMTEEEHKKFNEMAAEAEQAYINHPKHGEMNRKRVQKAKNQIEMLTLKYRQMKYRFKLEE